MSAIPSTQWTLISRARSVNGAVSGAALNQLCEMYWFPIYAFVRSSNHGAHDAQDLTQGFFEKKVITGELFAKANQTKGRLRTLVLAAVKNFLHNEWTRETALKRGQGATHFSIDEASAEGWYGAEPIESMTPDRLFQRRWALAVLDSTMKALRDEYQKRNKLDVFENLRGFLGMLPPDAEETTSAQAAARLGMDEGAVRTAISRLRRRFQEMLRDQVAQTLDDPSEAEIRDELSELNDFL
ncbi:RNA polymerase subunit sigma-24 [Prosthecobacter sp.]|uniref:RNA polymerase sigma factor n=1 Tax=Prosthecobacter sp. TaxID=1965333 RepID=UPI001D972BF4|nr:RNA polymerase subunit sigma-24 [Prosthecobacter sp.]MCB1278814.1 sigma-70 family RNA polymerase sigma factor [Prosthecobacter sp.]